MPFYGAPGVHMDLRWANKVWHLEGGTQGSNRTRGDSIGHRVPGPAPHSKTIYWWQWSWYHWGRHGKQCTTSRTKGKVRWRWKRREWEMRAEAAMIKSKLECGSQTGSRPTVQSEGCEQQERARVLLSCDAQCAVLMWGLKLTETIKGWSTAKSHSMLMKQTLLGDT